MTTGATAGSAASPGVLPGRSHAGSLFVLVLTVLSLAIVVAQLLPLPAAVGDLLRVYDVLICLVFFIDFLVMLWRAPGKRAYVVRDGGWLDLLGSIPSIEGHAFTGIARLARVARLVRIVDLLRREGRTRFLRDVLANRGAYAAYLTLFSAILVVVLASTLVLIFEAGAPGANLTTGDDALWWAIVTITTVGYGDHFPVTELGRITAVAVMFVGVGIIGALASIMASVLVPDPDPPAPSTPGPATDPILAELAAIRAELAAMQADRPPREPERAIVGGEGAGGAPRR